MKKLLLISTILLSILSVNADSTLKRTYIVNEDGTVTFFKRVVPSQDRQKRIYIVNEDGTITFLNRTAPSRESNFKKLEDIRLDIANFIDRENTEKKW